MRLFIKNYIDRINLSDVKDFGIKNQIFLSDSEASILFYYLKNNWEDLLYGDSSKIIGEVKEKFDSSKSFKIINLFNCYLDKYKNYL